MASVLSSSTSASLRTQINLKPQPQNPRSQNLSVSVLFPNPSLRLCTAPLNCFFRRRGFRSSAVDTSSERHVNSGADNSHSSDDLQVQLQELLDEVKSMVKLGKEGDAVDLLRANYEAVNEQMDLGAQGIQEAAVLDVIALGYMVLGDLRTVGSLMDELHKIVIELDDEELFLDSILMHMGSMCAKLKKIDLSIRFYRRSLQILERKHGTKSPFICTPLLGMAKVLGASGKATEAIEMYQQVIQILESSRGSEDEGLIVPLCALGNLLVKEEKTSDAESIFSRVVNIYISLYGENDGRVAMAMCSLAKVKCAKGNVNEAIDLYKTAIQILRDSKELSLDDEAMEKMRVDLAELLHAVGRGEEGRALIEECLLTTEKSKGKDSPSLVPHLVNLATSYSRYKNYAEAERLLRISLQIMMKTVGPDDPSITFPMLHLAVTLYNLHRDEEAEKLAIDILCIREKAFGRESLPVGEALDCLVSIQMRLEKDDSGLVELLKRVLKIQEKAFGSDSKEVIDTLKKIVHYLDKMGMKDEKYPLQKRLSVLRNRHKRMAIY